MSSRSTELRVDLHKRVYPGYQPQYPLPVFNETRVLYKSKEGKVFCTFCDVMSERGDGHRFVVIFSLDLRFWNLKWIAQSLENTVVRGKEVINFFKDLIHIENFQSFLNTKHLCFCCNTHHETCRSAKCFKIFWMTSVDDALPPRSKMSSIKISIIWYIVNELTSCVNFVCNDRLINSIRDSICMLIMSEMVQHINGGVKHGERISNVFSCNCTSSISGSRFKNGEMISVVSSRE